MNKTIVFITAALALSVFLVACTSHTPMDAAGAPPGATGAAAATPEAQADSAASQAVMDPNNDVTIGELV